jgi:hypothetical protein
MKVEELSQQTRDKISPMRYDRIIEKHEGPFSWKSALESHELEERMMKYFPDHDPIAETPQFLQIDSHNVLLPVGRKHHPNITILHHFLSQDLSKMVIYLTDSTYYDSDEGYVAICDSIYPENFYIATIYHEWFVTDYKHI